MLRPTRDVDESVPRDGAFLAVKIEVEQSTLPVTVVKLVADVPAQGTKLLPLLQHMQSKTLMTVCTAGRKKCTKLYVKVWIMGLIQISEEI